MSMIKKTIILAMGDEKGYVTLVKIGSCLGAKIIINEMPDYDIYLSLKIGNQVEYVLPIKNEKTEIDLPLELYNNDVVGILVFSEKGIFCAGGRRELVNVKKSKELIKQLTLKAEKEKLNAVEEIKEEALAEESVFLEASSFEENSLPHLEAISTESPKDDATVIDGEFSDTVSDTTATTPSENVKNVEESEQVIPEIVDDKVSVQAFGKDESFYQNARSRIEEILTVYPKEKTLSKLIPESEWVKVEYDADDYYVVGVLKEDGKVTHIGYGVPGIQSVKPPKEIEAYCDFLPLDNEKGYWLMFQNPEDGTMISN